MLHGTSQLFASETALYSHGPKITNSCNNHKNNDEKKVTTIIIVPMIKVIMVVRIIQ